jgi:hypothetical protein
VKLKVGDYARNIESGWLGKILRIYNSPSRFQAGDPLVDNWMAEMIGVDTLVVTVTGCSWADALSENDMQHHAIDDLRIVK